MADKKSESSLGPLVLLGFFALAGVGIYNAATKESKSSYYHSGSSYSSNNGRSTGYEGIPARKHGGVPVRGYYRKNGTYVAPHYRSGQNSLKHDNWSTRGNTNPYTGKRGYR
jgi:hypothetical protein